MLKTRVIPCLLLKKNALVKPIRFKDPSYVGDPINAVKIYNEKEVDELIFLDIAATNEGRGPFFKLIAEIADECFMPFAYGGGIRKLDQAEELFRLGVEKVVLNTYAVENPQFVKELADIFGSQSIVVSIDAKRNRFESYEVYTHSGKRGTKLDVVNYAIQMAELGAGEIMINAIDRDGTMDGYDLQLIKKITDALNIPVIAAGGAGELLDFQSAVVQGGASAVAAGSIFVYQGRNRAVLINYPTLEELKLVLA